jgi:hypothetical protein
VTIAALDATPESGHDDGVFVSPAALARHLCCTRTYVMDLVDQRVLERRRADGKLDQDKARADYIAHLRKGRSTAKSAADAEHVIAKTRMLESRLAEREKRMIRTEDAAFDTERLIGLFLTHLGGFGARIGIDRDMVLRRRVEAAVFDLRTALGKEMAKIADERDEPKGSVR